MRALAATPLALALAASALSAAAQESRDTRPETRISLDFKDADILDVVRLMSEVGSFQVVVDPGVACKLTLKLKEVPWDAALDVALRSCGLGHEEESGIVRVAPVARLTEEAAARRRLAEEQRLDRPLRTTRYRLSYAKATELAPLIKKFLSPRGEVVVDPRTNTLIITDIE